MVEIVPTVVNGVAISLEVAGFIIMLKSLRAVNLRLTNADQVIAQPASGKDLWALPALPDRKRQNIGIYLIIAGLAGQIIAMFA